MRQRSNADGFSSWRRRRIVEGFVTRSSGRGRALSIVGLKSEPMTPDQAIDKQIEIYRSMTGKQRLKIALDLHAFALETSRAGIRHKYPDAIDEEVDAHLRRRIEASRV